MVVAETLVDGGRGLRVGVVVRISTDLPICASWPAIHASYRVAYSPSGSGTWMTHTEVIPLVNPRPYYPCDSCALAVGRIPKPPPQPRTPCSPPVGPLHWRTVLTSLVASMMTWSREGVACAQKPGPATPQSTFR